MSFHVCFAADSLLVVPGSGSQGQQRWQAASASTPWRPDALQTPAAAGVLPSNAPAWQRRLAAQLRTWRLPGETIVALTVRKPRLWAYIALWFAALKASSYLELAPVFILCSILAVIFLNLGQRQPGEASAYTIFNDFRPLPGQLDAGQIDDQVRHGQM